MSICLKVYVHVCLVSVETRSGLQMSWNWNYGQV